MGARTGKNVAWKISRVVEVYFLRAVLVASEDLGALDLHSLGSQVVLDFYGIVPFLWNHVV